MWKSSVDRMSESCSPLAILHQGIKECQKCRLRAGCQQTVPGEGAPNAAVVFLAEAPGETEDMRGRPLIGRAGEDFRDTARKTKLLLSECYVSYLVRCMPPDNRIPNPDELEACWPWTLKTLQLIRPKIIVRMGDTALRMLAYKLGFSKQVKQDKIIKLAGKPFYVEARRFYVYPLFHPLYALRRKEEREVFKAHMRYLKQAIPGWIQRV